MLLYVARNLFSQEPLMLMALLSVWSDNASSSIKKRPFWPKYFDVALTNDIESVAPNLSSTSQYAEET